MPELPEVETVRLGLVPAMEGRRFIKVEARRPDLRWQRYRLRGPVLVDGWGREILYRSQPIPGLLSAGKDGVFVCDPGPDGIITSSAAVVETTRSGDDRNGVIDNLTIDPP